MSPGRNVLSSLTAGIAGARDTMPSGHRDAHPHERSTFLMADRILQCNMRMRCLGVIGYKTMDE